MFARGERRLNVVSMDGRWVRLLQLTGRRITARAALRLDGASAEAAADWLRQTCAERQIHAGAVLVANPSHLTTTRVFTLPSSNSLPDPTAITLPSCGFSFAESGNTRPLLVFS